MRLGAKLRIAALVSVFTVFWNPHAVTTEPGRLLEKSHTEVLQASDVEQIVAELFPTLPVPAARYSVDCYLIRYRSSYPDGSAAPITAQLFIPRDVEKEQAPLYVFAPGTTGLIDACRPSREHIAGIHWGLYRSHVLAFAGKGFVTLLPDYTGFGDPERLQPVFHARSEATMMLDGVRAVRNAIEQRKAAPQVTEGAFLAGFSQGGHAAFAAADLQSTYAPDVQLAGIIGYGPTTNMHTLFREFPVVVPMIAHVFAEIYGADSFDPANILQDRWLTDLEHHVTRQCIGAMQSYYPWNARELLRDEFAEALFDNRLSEAYPKIHEILTRNSTGISGHGVPALILQGAEDIVISPRSQEEFVDELRDSGSEVRYLFFEDARHDTRQIGFRDVLEWIEEQSAKVPGRGRIHLQR